MATVPGDPMERDPVLESIHPSLRPTQADLLLAAGMMHQEGRLQLAGDIVPFQRKPLNLIGSEKDLDEYKKMMTRDTLSRALGGGAKVLPIKPDDK